MTRSMKLEHQRPADHIPKLAVRLHPIPSFAELLRQSPAARTWVRIDQLIDLLNVISRHSTAAVFEDRLHRSDR